MHSFSSKRLSTYQRWDRWPYSPSVVSCEAPSQATQKTDDDEGDRAKIKARIREVGRKEVRVS